MLKIYRRISSKHPYSTSFATCFLKGGVCDIFAQTIVERKQKNDLKRTFSFSVFSGGYLGCCQHIIYNIWFTRLLGSKQTLLIAIKKSMVDFCVHVPFLYLPLYYTFENVFLGKGVTTGLKRLYTSQNEFGKPELPKVMSNYASLFPVVHVLNFTYTPKELRISVIACVSLCWLVVLSTVSHR
jgi:hypothetical protein